MNVTRKNILPLVLTLFLILTACEYMEEPTVEDADLLVNTWIVQKVYIDGQEDIVTNYDQYELVINQDNSFSLTTREGTTYKGNWQLEDNNTQLVLTPENDDLIRYRVANLAAEEMILLYEDKFFKDIPSTFRFVLVPA